MIILYSLFIFLADIKVISNAAEEIHGVSGMRFSGKIMRASPELQFSELDESVLATIRDVEKCDKWIVVTSIFEPSEATKKMGDMTRRGWCFVVVGDMNAPPTYNGVEGVIYLTPELQRGLRYQIFDHIPWKHFGRKNLGYLFAIEHGAKVIYDTDDDNRLRELSIPILEGKVDAREPVQLSSMSHVFNPYHHFNSSCDPIWPRGYPLDEVQDFKDANELRGVILNRPPSVQQFLADVDPDVDAIYRLTRPLPCFFNGTHKPLVLPAGTFAPYNAQATVHLYEAFWGLLLPVTVHGRVSDIWRSYFTSKLLWMIDRRVGFIDPHVIHDRVAHDYLKDFQSEQKIYLQATALVNFLNEWSSNAPTFIGRMEHLWSELYARDFIEIADFKLMQAWIKDLQSVNYEFPRLHCSDDSPRKEKPLSCAKEL